MSTKNKHNGADNNGHHLQLKDYETPVLHVLDNLRQVTDAFDTGLAQMQEAIKNAPRERASFTISHWPAGLVRSLMVAGHKFDATVRMACEKHTQLQQGLESAQELQQTVASLISEGKAKARGIDRLLKDNLARWKRERQHIVETLGEYGVVVREVEEGADFDPEVHAVAETVPVGKGNTPGTIAAASTPVYVWRDEYGQDQVHPAQVTLFEVGN